MIAKNCENCVGKSPTSDSVVAFNKCSKVFLDLVIQWTDIPYDKAELFFV